MLHRVIGRSLLRIALLSILVGALPPAPMPIALAKSALVGPPAPALAAASPSQASLLHSPVPPPDFVPPPLRRRAPQPPPPQVPPPHPTGPRIFKSKPGTPAGALRTESTSIRIQSAATGSIANSYIKTLTSAGGRFVTGTTGGDPTTPNDDNKKLLFGFDSDVASSDVGSSFSTLRISTGSTTNDYRLGSTDWDSVGIAPTTGPTSDGTAITTVWERDGVRVEERLTLAPDPASGNRNVNAVTYTVTNTNTANRIVGMRLMLDVQVGNNDGAPYLVADAGQVVNQREWRGAQVPSYWIAYESATFAQNSLRGYGWLSGSDATRPDRFVVADWQQVFFGEDWEYTVNPADPVTNDSAVIMYYNPVTVGPGQTKTYRAYYGAAIGSAIPGDQVWVPECPCADPHNVEGGPFDTRTGNLWTGATDLSVAAPGPALTWARYYVSQSTADTSGALGAGWQHPFATRLITETMSGGEAGRVIVVSPKGNHLRFNDLGNGQFAPFPGINATLSRTGDTYVVTWRQQDQLIFAAASGRLTAMRDAQGRQINLTYNTTNPAQLDRVVDADDPGRFLALTYTGDGHIATLSDGSRTVQYSYLNGDLRTVTDVMGRTTTYSYQNHLLTGIDNALGQPLERTSYDVYTPAGKVVSQTLQDGRQLQVAYLAASTVITTTGQDGRREVKQINYYDPRNTMTGMVVNGSVVQESSYNEQFSPSRLTDGNGNPTSAVYTTNGLPLTMTNALNQTAYASYDSHNNLTQMVDTLGRTTLARYDAFNNVISTTVGITTTSPIRATTLYTYTYNVPGVVGGRLLEQRGPDGVVTHYEYDPQKPWQLIRTIVGYGTPLAQTTALAYDAQGRLAQTTIGDGTSLARTDLTVYNRDNTLAKTIQNYKDGSFTPARPDEDSVTTYGYDRLGRTVAVTDTLGHVTATHYKAAGQVDWTIRNLTPLQFDSQGQPIYRSYSVSLPDANVATLYGYDGLGRTMLMTETGILTGTFNTATLQFSDATTRVTRTEYDQLSRPVTVTLNYRPNLPTGTLPDVNLQLLTTYDSAGNVTGQRDAFGRWSYVQYDALSRPITTTLNYENGNPRTVDAANQSWTDGSDTDLVTVTRYDAAGQVTRQIDNAVDTIFTATEPITDRITLYQYDTLGRLATTTQNSAPGVAGTALNRMTTTRYDALTGRVIGQQDALSRWVSMQYDLLGRHTTTIQNCRDAGGTAVAQGCATFSSALPDRNVTSQTRYDALGRTFETVDALGHVTHSAYDGMSRAVMAIQNYVAPGTPTTPITNVTTLRQYDALGRTTVMTDAVGAVMRSGFDRLGHTIVVTDSVGRVTRMGYDGSGMLRWTKRPDGQITVNQVDGLGRTVTAIVNYQDGVVGTNEPLDRDLITRTGYDRAGRRERTTDPTGRLTVFAYDLHDGLIGVQENVLPNGCAGLAPQYQPCNVVTRYRYDRAGNRTAIIDPRTNVRRFSYDAANQQTGATDALNRTTTWDYDTGGRVTTQHDPRGTSNDLSFSYDGLDRLTQTSALNLGTITAGYNGLGWRTSLTNGTDTTSFHYDPLGRITQLTAPQTGSVGYGYNARGQRTQLTYPDGTTLAYGYYADGRLQTVNQGATTLASYTYDPAGRLHQVSRANSATTTYSYDAADRLRDLQTMVGSTQVSDFAYQVDRLGLRTVVTETLPLSTTGGMAAAALSPSTSSAAVRTSAATTLSGLPLAFVPNQGQTDASVRYLVRSRGGTLFFTPSEAVLAVPLLDRTQPLSDETALRTPRVRDVAVARLRFEGTQGNPQIQALSRLPGVVNYLIGSNPQQWKTNLPTYAGVAYTGLYAGIDLRYEGSDGQLKRTYTVAAGADASRIRWRYTGATDVRLDSTTGDLLIALPARTTNITGTTLIEHAPLAWQDIGGQRIMVKVGYVVAANGSVSFTLGAYDHTQPLTIDPVLSYSTFHGGSGNEDSNGITLDSSGNAYLIGGSYSSNFPTVNPVQGTRAGSQDITVSKLSADGHTLLYSTFLGGSGEDEGRSIALDASGNIVLAGEAASSNFPTLNALDSSYAGGTCNGEACNDAVVVELNATGSALRYSTYLGSAGDDRAEGVGVDSSGNIYATGVITGGLTILNGYAGTAAGGEEAFLVKLNPSLSGSDSLLYSTYLGGSVDDEATGLALDSSGNVYLTGRTYSSNFPTKNPRQSSRAGNADVFVTKLNPSASGANSLLYSTFLGGSGYDKGAAIAVDGSGIAYISGYTRSSNFPTLGAYQAANAGDNEVIVAKLNPALSGNPSLLYSSYLGTSGDDRAFGIAVSGSTVTLTGYTGSSTFPTASPTQASFGGGTCGTAPSTYPCPDAFVTQINLASNTLSFSTFLGGNNNDQGYGVAVDSAGAIYVTGTTYSSNFPTTSGARQTTFAGGSRDGFVTKIGLAMTTPATRVISYSYDGLLRLTGAVESPGTTYAYGYDLAGNRTSVTVNGGTPTTLAYDAANQVQGWSYDAAGNLTNDGTTSYTYDALNRMLTATAGSQTRNNTYNGDGVLVAQTANSVTTRYSQDLAAPLNQVLQTQGSTTTNYLYGLDRLGSVSGSTRTWYVGDALGSVRRTLSDTGAAVGSVVNYDPWGTPESGSVPTFGFTGELQDSATGLVNLRARWYSTASGAFTAKDRFLGVVERPPSQHPYMYVGNSPVNYGDPSGAVCIQWLWGWATGDNSCAPLWYITPDPGQSYLDESLDDLDQPASGALDSATRVAAEFVVGLGAQGAQYADEFAGTHGMDTIAAHSSVATTAGMVVAIATEIAAGPEAALGFGTVNTLGSLKQALEHPSQANTNAVLIDLALLVLSAGIGGGIRPQASGPVMVYAQLGTAMQTIGCVLTGIRSGFPVLLAQSSSSPSPDDLYIQGDGSPGQGFDSANANTPVKLGYGNALDQFTGIPGVSIKSLKSWFESGLASLGAAGRGWQAELLDAMKNTKRINFMIDGMDIFNQPQRFLKANEPRIIRTHWEMDQIIELGYTDKLHLWENGQEITGQTFVQWIRQWRNLRGI